MPNRILTWIGGILGGDQAVGDASRWQLFLYHQPLLLLAACSVIGILADDWVGGHKRRGPALIWITVVAICAGAVVLVHRKHLASPQRKATSWSAVLAICGLVTSVSALNYRWNQWNYASASIMRWVSTQPTPAIIQGTVTSTPSLRGAAQRFPDPLAARGDRAKPAVDRPGIDNGRLHLSTDFLLSVHQVRAGRDFVPASGNVRVFVDGRCDDLLPGTLITVYGNIRRADAASNPGGRDPATQARRGNIHASISLNSADRIELISAGSTGWILHRWVARLASSGRDILLSQLGPDTGPLAVALVLGQRNFVRPDQRDQLLVTGTAHLLSVSGMHLAIVVSMVSFLLTLLRFPLPGKIVVTLAVCVFYTALTGGRPPVVRAAILVTTFAIALWMRRPSQPINTLSLAGILLLAMNPENLFSVGVQLSFLAVATLVLCTGRLRRRGSSRSVDMALDREERLRALADNSQSRLVYRTRVAIAAMGKLTWFSLCVSAVAAPLVWHHFNLVSFVSVFANVVLGPTLFVALGSGLVTVLASWISPILGWPAAMLCHLSILMMQWVISLAATTTMGHLWLPAPGIVWVALFYVVLAATLLLRRSMAARFIRCGWIGIWMVMSFLLVSKPAKLPGGTLELTFVDVGHGTCVIVRGGQKVLLYDCGRLGNPRGTFRDIDHVLWSLGVTRIDAVLLSHADSDHFNAVPGILRRFYVSEIITPPGMLSENEPALQPVVDAIRHYRVDCREVSAGQRIAFGNQQLDILHPPGQRIAGNDNANSLVVLLRHAGRSVLLPGDLEPPGTRMLVAGDRLPAGGVMMAPHHGSLSLDADTILQWARPSEAIVSGGRLARRPEVTRVLAQRGSGVHVTALSGAVRVRIAKDGEIEVRSWLESPW